MGPKKVTNLLSLALGLLASACSGHQPRLAVLSNAPPSASAATETVLTPDARTLAVYRTVADSVYIRSTQRTVAVMTTPLDTACAVHECATLADRWAIGSLQWNGVDAAEMASARQNWLANNGRAFDLRNVPTGWPNLVSIDAADTPSSSSDVAEWISFRDANAYAAGAVRFSSVSFGQSGKTALVTMEWRCGPTCGHSLSAALVATGENSWRIDDMVLVSSLQHSQ